MCGGHTFHGRQSGQGMACDGDVIQMRETKISTLVVAAVVATTMVACAALCPAKGKEWGFTVV